LLASVSLEPSQAWKEGDCDADGVKNEIEVKEGPDTDSDGKPNYLDADDDGDGVTTKDEDRNKDGNYRNDDCNGNGIPDYLDSFDCSKVDSDGDGVPDAKELSDGTDPKDGCSFRLASVSLEPSQAWKDGDCDGDGLKNGIEIKEGPDTDKNGIPNFLDPDDDGDGIPTATERGDLNDNGIPDYTELTFLIARDDSITVGLGLSYTIAVTDNDENSFSDFGFDILVQPTKGSISVNKNTGTIEYTPAADFVGRDSLTYKICNPYNQCDEATVYITVDNILVIPQIFTPNGNGQNDYFVIKNIELYGNNRFTVVNRWGNVVYEQQGYSNQWDGYSNTAKLGSKPLPVGTYFYVLTYGEAKVAKGFIYLKR
jgi:gliding motility-associated-like protein